MELLETNDAKGLLLKKTAKHKKGLEDEIKLLSENTEKIVTNALIIAGSLALTYFVITRLSKGKTKKKPKGKVMKLIQQRDSNAEEGSLEDDGEDSVISQIGTAIATQATVFLLGLAKDKLSAYLKSNFNKEAAPTNERS